MRYLWTSPPLSLPTHPYLPSYLPSSYSPSTPRARPKSQIVRSQLALTNRLEGFKSRCKTLALCKYLRPRSTCYRVDRYVYKRDVAHVFRKGGEGNKTKEGIVIIKEAKTQGKGKEGAREGRKDWKEGKGKGQDGL